MSETIPPRKYLTEAMINLCTSHVLFIPPDQLHNDVPADSELARVLSECHIYLICRRPVLSFDPKTFAHSGDLATGHLVRRVDGAEQRVAFKAPLRPPKGSQVVVGSYPHRRLESISANAGSLGPIWSANTLSLLVQVSDPSVRHCEVIYVGQAFGDGSRSAIDRLRSHSTLQRILADMAAKRPDGETMLFLFKYEPYSVVSLIDGISKSEIGGTEDSAHFMSILDNPLSEKQQIGLAEAGLIRYFSPEYNELYKESFPNERLKILDECYRLDFAALTVEIDTESVNAPLWSSSRGMGVHHIASFDLHDLETRRSFFSMVDKKGEAAVTNISGPTY